MKTDPQIPFNIDEKPTFRTILKKNIQVQRDKIKLWENAELIQIEVPINRKNVSKILPIGLRPDQTNTATLFVANYPKTAFTGSYMEAALLIHVKSLLGRKGVHCCWMVVDDDTALIYGRELLGFPKKMAEIPYLLENDTLTTSVKRRGTKVLSIKAVRSTQEINPEPVFAKNFYNISGLGQLYLINPVWYFKPREAILESWKASAELQLEHSHFDPIRDLIADYSEVLEARFSIIDILSAKLMYPVGIAGFRSLYNAYNLRFR